MSNFTPEIAQLNIPEPYNTWIEQRTNFIMGSLNELGVTNMAVLPRPLSSSEAANYGIDENMRILGGVIPDDFNPDKHNLHVTLPHADYFGSGYDRDFAAKVRDSVLSGYTVFNIDQLNDAINAMFNQGFSALRLKDASQSDIEGQANCFRLEDVQIYLNELRELGSLTEDSEMPKGVVVEPLILDPTTAVIGQIDLDCGFFTYIGGQIETVNNEARVVYGGGRYDLFRGTMEELIEKLEVNCAEPEMLKLLKKAQQVDQAYKERGVKTHARVYDVLSGVVEINNKLVHMTGVTDPSFRTAGSTAGALQAIIALKDNPDLTSIGFSTVLIYNPKENLNGQQGTRVIDHEDLVILTNVNNNLIAN